MTHRNFSHSTYIYSYYHNRILTRTVVHGILTDLEKKTEQRIFAIMIWYEDGVANTKMVGVENKLQELGRWDEWMENVNSTYVNDFEQRIVEKFC